MIKEYRRKEPIKAEQFDGSAEMMRKYSITSDGFDGRYTFRFENNCLPLRRGWWIVNCESIALFGVRFNDWQTMDNDKFWRTYEEVDDND